MSTSVTKEHATRSNLEVPTLSNQRYQIQRCIGIGGMAAVFKAYDTSLKVDRALKILKPEFLLGDDIRNRFQTEAVAMANLKHENIVQIYDLGLEGMTLYIVMEYIPYGSAKRYLKKHGKLTVGQAARVCLDIANALDYAHRQGFIHRDVKPDNILLTDTGALLGDFGIAKDTVADDNNTRTNVVMGTLQYMSPEQRLNSKHTTAQTDLYALVATFFNLITLEKSVDLFVEEVRTELVADLPVAVQSIIHKGCCTDLNQRYASAIDLIEDLQALLETEDFQPLHLIPIQTPQMTEQHIQELNRVWNKYTTAHDDHVPSTFGHMTEDDLQTMPTRPTAIFSEPLNLNANADVNETWVNLSSSKIESGVSEAVAVPKDNQTFIDTLINFPRRSPKVTATGAFIVVASLIMGHQWNDFALMNILTKPEVEMLQLESENNSDVVQFEKAKELVFDGKLHDAAKILNELHKSEPLDPLVQNLYTLTMILAGHHSFPPSLFATTLSSVGMYSDDPTSSETLKELFKLSSKSWDPLVPRIKLEEDWLQLIEETNDPLIELNYLILMRYKLGTDFPIAVEQYASQNPELGVIPHLKVLAAEIQGDMDTALEILTKETSKDPTDSDAVVQRARLLLKTGKKELASDSVQQVLLGQSHGAALELLTEIESMSDDGQSSQDKLLMQALGDEIPTVNGLHVLYRLGEFRFAAGDYAEARKLWDFCVNQAERSSNEYYTLLGSLRSMDANLRLNPVEVQSSDIEQVRERLEKTTLHFTVRKKMQVYLKYLIGRQALAVEDLATYQSMISELEEQGEVASFGLSLPGLVELQQEYERRQ